MAFAFKKFKLRTSLHLSVYLFIISFICMLSSMIYAIMFAPLALRHGNWGRMIYVHVPCANIAVNWYLLLALLSFGVLLGKNRSLPIAWQFLATDFLKSLVRAMILAATPFTVMAIIAGMIWGQVAWGTWWYWDARLTSMLILTMLYCILSYLSLKFADSLLIYIICLLGCINVPLIKLSVVWFKTLHQPASIKLLAPTTIASPILYPLLLSIASSWACVLSLTYLIYHYQKSKQKILVRQTSYAVFLKNK